MAPSATILRARICDLPNASNTELQSEARARVLNEKDRPGAVSIALIGAGV